MLFDFLIKKNECKHNRVAVDTDEAYCPDCGALIKNKWYLVRCSCCNIKRTGHNEYNEIKPDTKYCPNCGGSDFYIQELEKVNFMDIHYAVHRKEVIEQKMHSTHQIWIEQGEQLIEEKKLLKCTK